MMAHKTAAQWAGQGSSRRVRGGARREQGSQVLEHARETRHGQGPEGATLRQDEGDGEHPVPVCRLGSSVDPGSAASRGRLGGGRCRGD
eukprot:1328222-Pyramimonas_sp.AAC.1